MQGGPEEKVTGYFAGTEAPVIKGLELPNGKRFAVQIQIALEDWDSLPIMAVAKGGSGPIGEGAAETVDYRMVSARLYGVRTGIHRLLTVMEETGCVASVCTSGLCGDRWPDLMAEVAERGHEVVAHGYSQAQEQAFLSEDEDIKVVERTVDTLEKVTGRRPVGWVSTGARPGRFTVKSLLATGLLYTDDFREADVPFVIARMGNRRLIAMPRTDHINDNYALHNAGHSPGNYVDYFKRSFDRLYKESDSEPGRVLTAVCHSTVSGHPWGASAIAECCEYVNQHEDVWQTTGRQIAEYYLSQLKP